MPKITVEMTEDEARSWLESRTRAVVEPETPEPEPETPDAPAEHLRDGSVPVDGEGMPFDPEIHSGPDKLTDQGLWRVKRGKAQEATQARAAFKAAGADVDAPEDVPVVPKMPGMEPVAPAPVTFDDLMRACVEALESGSLTRAQMMALYGKHTGASGSEADIAAQAAQVFQTDESARAAMLADIQ